MRGAAGALAGNDKIYEDVLKQSGVIRARSLQDLLQFARGVPVLMPKGENVPSTVPAVCRMRAWTTG